MTSLDLETEVPQEIAEPLKNALAGLVAAKSIRPANEPIPGFHPPEALLLESFIGRLRRAPPQILAYEALSIREAIVLPVLADDPASSEHLAIYEQLADLRATLQTLHDKAVVAGFRPAAVIKVPTSELDAQLPVLIDLLNKVIAQNNTKKPGIGDLKVSLGPVGADLKTIDALATQLLKRLRGAGREIDAKAVFTSTEALADLARHLHVKSLMLSWQAGDEVRELVARLRVLIDQIADVGRQILLKALTWQAQKEMQKRRSAQVTRQERRPNFDVAVDFGTSTVRVWEKKLGLRFDQPSLVALFIHSQGPRTLWAVGYEAAATVGRTPSHIETVRLMERGGLVDTDQAAESLRSLLKQAAPPVRPARRHVLATVQTRGAEAHRRAISEMLQACGFQRVTLLERSLAAAIGARVDVTGDQPVLVVDLGAGSTDMGLFSQGQMAAGRTLLVGGDDIDEAVVKSLRAKLDVLVNPKRLADVYQAANAGASSISVVGRDLRQGVPREFRLSSVDVAAGAETPSIKIAEGVRDFIETFTPDQRLRLAPVVLTGGGANLRWLVTLIEKVAGVAVVVSDNPERATIEGCGRFVEEQGLDAEWAARGQQ